MNLFLDCEFNGLGGELISMALVDEDGHSFYEVLTCTHPIPWLRSTSWPQFSRQALADLDLHEGWCGAGASGSPG